jgi:N-acetylneuraminic acid mutarotase
MGYICCGYDSNGVEKRDLWQYSQSANFWTQKTQLPGTARSEAIAFSIGTKGYVGLGANGNSNLNEFWEWDQASNTWTQKANFAGTPRNGAVAFSIGTKGYVGTGEDVNGYQEDFWEWDQATNTWTRKANFTGGVRVAAVGFSIGNLGYIGTGWNSHQLACKDFWVYDPATDLWVRLADFGGTARVVATGFSIGTKGYIGTGFDNVSRKDFFEYTPGPAGVNELQDEVHVNTFPNPVSTSVTFEMEKEMKNAELKLFDVSGNEVVNKTFSGNKVQLERNDLPAGIYFYGVNENGLKIASGKIVVE